MIVFLILFQILEAVALIEFQIFEAVVLMDVHIPFHHATTGSNTVWNVVTIPFQAMLIHCVIVSQVFLRKSEIEVQTACQAAPNNCPATSKIPTIILIPA